MSRHRLLIEIDVVDETLADEALAVERGIISGTTVRGDVSEWSAEDLENALGRPSLVRSVEVVDYTAVLSEDEQRAAAEADARERARGGDPS